MGELPRAWGRGGSAVGDWSRGGGGRSIGGGTLSRGSQSSSIRQGCGTDNNPAGDRTRSGKRWGQPGGSACPPSGAVPRAPLWPPGEGL